MNTDLHSNAEQSAPSHEEPAPLDSYELYWRDRRGMLEDRGYMLRPRYCDQGAKEGRVKTTPIDPPLYEHYSVKRPVRTNIMDATRISDGKLVMIKAGSTKAEEFKTILRLSTPELRADPRNPCVPMLDHFVDIYDDQISYIVTPFFRRFDDPPFQTFQEILDCIDALLNVCSTDCARENIVIDAAALYPQGFHPAQLDMLPDLSGPAPILKRSQAPCRYYFFDYEQSLYIPVEVSPKIAPCWFGWDSDIPEVEFRGRPYDPFKADVWLLGRVIRREFCCEWSGLEFSYSWALLMTNDDPALRPDAAGCLATWKDMCSKISLRRCCARARLRYNDRPTTESRVQDLLSYMRALRQCAIDMLRPSYI
ncbi:uncharacterized protein PHACADRAFT_154568 [Phanerochaete carnosa HHB-10118-sp]|uniref:Protein kinase domain-containing protein n=1 Tax=Phanerochaete carnosa (strain HHB-10118-sp) TaxID=650164 RepID=K5VTM9_PHACS|nr:uncharacterized protein PHACADRAFT_154568 [Phanerochaete carnosa HHB-10118-sp]EKM49914.1 hypothetical protein PHACADRAFT_154568 [Phanerochaete carnosa HHB-10118-sp]